ncbi:MAG: triple tyrosine motif-containing protein [Bacteroidales bacterium]|nr:triple tyrosine motif-containing protein [Bacteroidales bacterium]
MSILSASASILRRKRVSCLFILFFFLNTLLQGQFKSIGVPEIKNIGMEVYGGGAQNWKIVDDDQGNIYVANNNGILRFDGADWERYEVENKSIVRSLASGKDGNLYVGAFNEIGVLERSDQKGIIYRSLNELIPEHAKNFDDIWNIYETRFGIVFQSFEYIFIYKDECIRVLEPGDRYGYSFYADDNYYVVEKGAGLRLMMDDSLVTVSDDPVFTLDEIHLLHRLNTGDLLIGTLGNGIYILSGSLLKPWNTEISTELKKAKLYCGACYNNKYLFGTIRSGLFVANQEGKIEQHISRSNGLQNNTVLSLFIDHQDNTWLGLDIGIDFLNSSLPISFINDNFNIAATYATVTFNDRLYVGTNQGLYSKQIDKLKNHTNIKYDLVEGTDGQVWNLSVIDGQLLCGHHNGAYVIDGLRSVRINKTRGVWNFLEMPGHDNLLLCGTYDGLMTLSKGRGGSWEYRDRVKGMDISSKDLIIEENNSLWMSHGYLGLFHIYLNQTLDSVSTVKEYKGSNGLPVKLPYILHESGEDFFVSTSQGIYQFDQDKELFTMPVDLNQFYGDLRLIYLLKQDPNGNIWYSAQDGMGVFRLMEDGTYKIITTPFKDINKARVSPFDNIYVHNPDNIYIGTQDGLVHYDPSIFKDYFDEMNVYINRVRISSRTKDSLWYFSGNSELDREAVKENFSIPHAHNNISFRFNSPDLENAGQIEYSFRLVNFDESWSEWTNSNEQSYTNLREDEYCFEVKARNTYNNISEIDRFHFIIEPPFHRSNTAIIIYFLLGSGLIVGLVYFYFRRMDKVRSQEKSKQLKAFRKKEQSLEEQKQAAEREVIHLKNEKLEAEMKHKNKELATSTYHLIQKNKFLNTLKDELSRLSKNARSEFVENELKKISRKIDRDIKNEKDWEVFNRYFDEVHQEFHSRLRELHPELTPGDLRLCAYLRMNISSKEIAPLMNISVRGVEISRYRLRKKMKLDRDTNLTDYIMTI